MGNVQTDHAAAMPSHGGDAHLSAADGLIQLSHLVQGIHARVSARHDLTPVQARLLCVLAFGPRRMVDLATCFGVETAALTGLVDRAERRGLVTRVPVPGDRRALHVTLTGAGQQAARAFHAAATEELEQMISPLTEPDQETFRRAMDTIIVASQGSAPTCESR